jgi:hypothetical protein
MKNKPITPAIHGLGDYAFAIALLTMPGSLTANRKTAQLYRLIALEVLLYGALTKHRFALKPLISLNTHRNIDVGNLAGMALLNAVPGIRKNKQLLSFHLVMLGLGLANVLFTDWKSKRI